MRITKNTPLTNDLILEKILSMQTNRHKRLKQFRAYYDFFEKPMIVTLDYINATDENMDSDNELFHKYFAQEGEV